MKVKRNEEGILTVMDALIFTVVLLIVTFLLVNILHENLTRTQDLRMSEIREKAVSDIHETVMSKDLNSSYEKDGHKIKKKLSMPDWIKNLLYLKYLNEKNGEEYKLTTLESNIKDVYNTCAWEICRYNFAIFSEYKDTHIFLSNKCDNMKEIPSDRGANTFVTTLDTETFDSTSDDQEEKLNIILYVWR